MNDCNVLCSVQSADQHKLAVASMIRDSITQEPPCRLRAAQMNGHLLLVAKLSAGGRWYALNPAKPEFYVRRGASPVLARMDEIAAGFSRKPGTAIGGWSAWQWTVTPSATRHDCSAR